MFWAIDLILGVLLWNYLQAGKQEIRGTQDDQLTSMLTKQVNRRWEANVLGNGHIVFSSWIVRYFLHGYLRWSNFFFFLIPSWWFIAFFDCFSSFCSWIFKLLSDMWSLSKVNRGKNQERLLLLLSVWTSKMRGEGCWMPRVEIQQDSCPNKMLIWGQCSSTTADHFRGFTYHLNIQSYLDHADNVSDL